MTILCLKLIIAGGAPEETGLAFRSMWVLSGSVGVILGVIFMPRTWCRFCPMGTMQGLLSKNKYLLNIDEGCVDCGVCKKVCPIETYPGEFKDKGIVDSENCLRCFNCIENCPKKILSFKDYKNK